MPYKQWLQRLYDASETQAILIEARGPEYTANDTVLLSCYLDYMKKSARYKADWRAAL